MIDASILYTLAGILLFGMGVFAMIVYPHLLRKILGMNVMGVGVFMVFIAISYQGPEQRADPIPHALVITGIVVAVCATGLALALAMQLHALTGSARTPSEGEE